MERLTDQLLATLEECAPTAFGHVEIQTLVLRSICSELRARRSAELTEEEREALDRLLRELQLAVSRDDENCLPHYRTCVSAISRLTIALKESP